MTTTDTEINAIGIFIDGGYYEKIAPGLNKKRLNLHNIIIYVQLAIARRFNLDKNNCIATEVHYFRGRFPTLSTNVNKHYTKGTYDDELIEDDVVMHLKHMRKIGGVNQEKGIDVWFALETFELALYRDLDFVVLVTGDSDHEMLARKIKALKKQVVLLTWNVATTDSTSWVLKEECTFHIDLELLSRTNQHIVDLFTGSERKMFSEMANDFELPFMDQIPEELLQKKAKEEEAEEEKTKVKEQS